MRPPTEDPAPQPDAEAALARAAAARIPVDTRTRGAQLAALTTACLQGLRRHASAWVDRACAMKRLDPRGPLRSEEIATGPIAAARALQLWRRSLNALAAGGLPPVRWMPALPYDRLLFRGYRAEVRLESGGPVQVVPEVTRGVGVVLGAGNVTCIPVADLCSLLFGMGLPTVVKLHPVQAGLLEVFEAAFAPLREVGCSFVLGDAEVARRLITDPRVVRIHLTGSRSTFDRVTATNAERPTPARISAELGNVTPVIVAPGRWRTADLVAQIDELTAMLTNNGGLNCATPRVIVTAARWPQRDTFVAMLRAGLDALPPRPAWFPPNTDAGATRYRLCEGGQASTPPPDFREEVFAPIVHELALDGDDTASFLRSAVRFCNEELHGTLAAHLLAPRAVLRAKPAEIRAAIDALQYGTVAVNTWSALAFAWMSTPWGAAPTEGLGFVHDPHFLRAAHKTVLWGPVITRPRPPWRSGVRHATATMERILELTLTPSLPAALRVVASALRG